MTEVELDGSRPPRSERAVELRVAPRLGNLAVVRTLVGAIGVFEDLDMDSVADLRLAVDEACTQLIRSARRDATLVVVVDPRDGEVVVEVSAACQTDDVVSPGGFSWHVLTSLTDDVQTFRDGAATAADGEVFGIALTTRRVGSAR